MRLARERILLFLGFAILLFCAVMAVRQFAQNQSQHAELREAFIFLHRTGHRAEAEKLYTKLLWNLDTEPTQHLVADFERTSIAAPTNESPNTNILVRYHRSIQRELEQRFSKEYLKARAHAEKAK
jgi:hypothetical protein